MKTSICSTMPGVAVLKKTQDKKKASKSSHSSDAVKENDMSNNNSHRPLPVKCVGHVLKDGEMRSQDVNIQEDVHFSDMYFKEEVLAGLHSTGFMKPSPVQLQAIPTGCCGLDLIIQAKSGTGKTCVFTVVALEMVVTSAPTCQVLVVAPTREIAVQIASVISSIGRHMAALRVQTFIGGTEVEKNISCHIAVGTPGRLHHLLSAGILSSKNIRLLVLDEADQLLESFRNVVLQVVAALPLSKQIICTSATYTPSLQDLAKKMMRSPSHISLGSKQLLAVTQYVHQLPYTESLDKAFRAKLLHLKGILGSAVFNQCLIFTNSITRCESVYDSLHRDGWPVARLCGGQTQQQRLKALDDLTNHRCRVMVATDLAARGLDSPHVSLVVSLEPPPHPHTYLHRVGRAGRFGSKGLSVVLACQGDDWLHVQAIATVLDLTLLILPDPSLAHDTEPLQRLPLLSPEQLQKWTLSTSHRLTYSSAVNGGSYDPLEVWKLNPSNGAAPELPTDSKSESNDQCVESPVDHGTNDGSSSSSGNDMAEFNREVLSNVASLPLTENVAKETLFSVSVNQSLTNEKGCSMNEKKGQRNENQCTKNEHQQKVCVLSEFKKICKDDGNVSTSSDLSSSSNSLNKNEKSIHSGVESVNFLDESTELKELAEIVHLKQPESASSFSFNSIRDEVEALASCSLDGRTHCGKVTVGHTAEDPSETTTTRLGVLLERQHQRHAARLEGMKEEWKDVTVSPREALKSLQKGSTTGELLAQLRQSQCLTDWSDAHQTKLGREGTAHQTQLGKEEAADQTKLDREGASARSSDEHIKGSQSVSHHTDAFQFHLGALMTEKQREKLDRKKRASVFKSRDEASGDVSSPVYLEVQSKEPEKSHRHHNGARKKERRAKVEVMHEKSMNNTSHVRSYGPDQNLRRSDDRRQNFKPLVLFDRSSNFNEHSKKSSNRSSVEDALSFQSHSSQRAEKGKIARHSRRPTGGYKYKCEFKGCSKDAVLSDEGASSQDVTSDEYYNYRDTRRRHERRQKTRDGCRLCAQEQYVDQMKDDFRAHLHYYQKFALMNYYVTVMGRTTAQHCMPQYYDHKTQVQCPDCVSNRRHHRGRNARESSSSDAGTRDTTSRRGAKQRDEGRK